MGRKLWTYSSISFETCSSSGYAPESDRLLQRREVTQWADSVAKVVLHWWLEILRAADVLFV
jgi:hypothetical protein